MYVDDGAISGFASSHRVSAQLVRTGLEDITHWLLRNGLHCDPDKTEFISFFPRRKHLGGLITELRFHNLPTGPLAVKRSDTIRYLGIFLHHRFDWTHHATIMANRARSTIRALNILGNSVRGLDYANWRRLFHALILPILTYGFPLYSTQPGTKGVMKILQTAQNDAVRKMSGCFKTTPISPLHYLMAIPPISLTINKLTSVFTLRIQRLPPFTLIRTITTFNPAADWHLTLHPETALTRLLPPSFPPFTPPSPPAFTIWSHPQVRNNTITKLSRESKEAIKHIISTPSYDTFHLFVRILIIPSPSFSAAFLLFRGQTLVHHGTSNHFTRVGALLSALCDGFAYAPISNHIRIFLPDLSINNYLFRTSKHPFLALSRTFTNHLSSFLLSDPAHHVDLFRYSIKWSGLPGQSVFEDMEQREQRIVFPLPPTPLLPPKGRLLRDFQHMYDNTNKSSRCWQSIIHPDGKPPPFYLGALSRKDRRTSCSAVQLAFDHAFTSSYSQHMRPTAGDNLYCPCNSPSALISLPPSPSSDSRMAEFHNNPRSPSLSPPHQPHAPLPRRQQPRPRRRMNTTAHVLFACPLHSSPRQRIFGRYSNDAFVFGTEDGGRKLSDFQRAANRLLRPLPPRPDPP